MPPERTARLPVLRSSVKRSDALPPRGGHPLRARLVALVLVLVSLALITVYFRESSGGVLHSAQRIGLSVLTPFEVAGERVSRPFRDAWAWTSDLVTAKSENAELRDELQDLRRQVISSQTAERENVELKDLLGYVDSARFPQDYEAISAHVIARPATAYEQEVVVAAGSSKGIRTNDPVVTDDGLVGIVSDVTGGAAKVQLLTDQESNVSAVVLGSGATGTVRVGASSSALVLDRVGKDELVEKGDRVISAGWTTGKLESLFPRGIPIGIVTGVGQQDVDLYKRIQVTPLVDFDSLDSVLVLVSKRPSE